MVIIDLTTIYARDTLHLQHLTGIQTVPVVEDFA